MKLAYASTSESAPELGPPRLYLHADGFTLSIGFEYSNDTLLRLEGGEEAWGDKQRLKAWAEAVVAKLGGYPPPDPQGRKNWYALPHPADFSADDMYDEDQDTYRPYLCVIACPVCGRDGRPLVRQSTTRVGGGLRWVGLDYQKPHTDYRTRCNFCHQSFRFTVFSPQ